MNGQRLTWVYVTTRSSQGSILGPALLLIYINDLANSLSSNAKLFADNAFLFSVTHVRNTAAN